MATCPACGAENPDRARFCNACGERLPDDARPAEVRKTVTVVFCDVAGSTALGEQLDPEALRHVMARYFEAMARAIERHGGTVEKFIGDAVMAVFGIPTAHEDDALRAVRAAADMRVSLDLLNKEQERDHGATLACRIGIHTGEVVAGDSSARQALVTGDAVNVAARLEQVAPTGEIVLSEATHRLVRDAVVAEPVPPLDLKGKAEPVAAYALREVAPEVAQVGRRFATPLVGRERQLAQLTQVFEQVVEDRVCALYTLIAPPGTGKSRLVREFVDRLGGRATVLRGRCLAYGEGITYWPLTEVLRDAVAGDGLADPQAAIAALLGDDERAAQVAGRLATLLGASGGAATAEEIAWAARRLLEAVARVRPVVVVLDDLQWGEPGFLDLVDQVSDWSRDAPILLLCMARPELLDLRAGWGGGKLRATNASLEPLSAPESAQLLAALEPGGLDDATRGRVLAAAGGNPLFVEEIVAMLAEDGAPGGGQPRAVPIPPTIHALLAARLDRLDEADRMVLGRASVVGEVFYLDAVRALSPQADRDHTEARVRGLLRRELVRPEPSDLPGVDAYRFHHVLLRDAAYAMLPKELRAELHESLARWLEQTVAGDEDEFVGYHLEQAHAYRRELGIADEGTEVLARRAARRLSAAGRRAAERADVVAARSLFARAASLAADPDAQDGWDRLRFAWALLDVERATEGAAVVDEVEAIARATGDARLADHADVARTFATCMTDPGGSVPVVRAVIDRVRPGFLRDGDHQGLAAAAYCAMVVPWFLCHFAEARALTSECAEHARAAGDVVLWRMALRERSLAAVFGSTSAEEMLSDAAQLEASSDLMPSLEPMASIVRATALGFRGEAAASAAEFARAKERSHEFYGFEAAHGFRESRALVAAVSGRPADAVADLRVAYGIRQGLGDPSRQSTIAGLLAVSVLDLGEVTEAHRLAEECRTLGDEQDMMNEVLWRRVEARLAAQGGDERRARALMDEMLELALGTDDLVTTAQAWLDAAEVQQVLGDLAAARASLHRAAETYAAKGALAGVADAEQRLAALG